MTWLGQTDRIDTDIYATRNMIIRSQEKLVKVLQEATESVIQSLPGFISANIHKSLDGTRIVNAQWKRKEDLEAMLQNPHAREHLDECFKPSQPDPHLYEVVHIHHS
jgi:quinol monooxygenase YgiN